MWRIRNPEYPDQLLALQPYQWDFALSESFATGEFGGWGAGKTTSGVGYIAVNAYRAPSRTNHLAVLPSYPMMKEWLEEVLLPAFQDVIIGHNRDRRVIYLPEGKKLLYRSAHIPRAIQMSNVVSVYLDEPHLMKREVFRHIVARARKKGSDIRIGLASLPKIGWLSEEFEGKDDAERRCLHVRTEQNRHNHPDYVRNLKKACPKSMWPCYLGGQFVPMGGTVYAEYGEGHIIAWRYNGRWVVMIDGSHSRPVTNISIDPSGRRPHVTWFQRIPKAAKMPGGWEAKREVSCCIDEIYPDGRYKGITVKRLCEMIKKRKGPDGEPYKLDCAVVDPASKAFQETGGESVLAQLERYLGIPVVYLTGQRVVLGVQHVQLALEPSVGHPFLYFSDYLKENPDPCCGYGDPEQNRERSVLKAMPGYSFPEEKDGRLPEEPHHDDIFSHAVDTVRYHVRYFYPEDRLSAEAWSAF